jgi:hypothetical protein
VEWYPEVLYSRKGEPGTTIILEDITFEPWERRE